MHSDDLYLLFYLKSQFFYTTFVVHESSSEYYHKTEAKTEATIE